MKKTTVRSINAEFFFMITGGVVFLGLGIYVMLVVHGDFDPFTYLFLAFGSAIFGLNARNALRIIVFHSDRIVIKPDPPVPAQFQLRYEFKYPDVEAVSFGELDFASNSRNEQHLTWGGALFSYRVFSYKENKCIVFRFRDGRCARLLVNKFTMPQRVRIIDEIQKRNIPIENIGEADAFVGRRAQVTQERLAERPLKYPAALRLATIAGIALFALFFVSYERLGGSAASDAYASASYEDYEPGRYYLSDHGNFTETTLAQWRYMSVLEIVFIASFIVMFVGNLIYILIAQRKSRT